MIQSGAKRKENSLGGMTKRDNRIAEGATEEVKERQIGRSSPA